MKKTLKIHKLGEYEPGEVTAQALARLLEYGLPARLEPTNAQGHEDAILTVEKGPAPKTYQVLEKMNVTAATIQHLVKEKAAGREPLVATVFIPPAVAVELRTKQIPYMDMAGNAWLAGPNFHLFVEGTKPEETNRHAIQKRRAYTTGGLKVTFALLANPERIEEPTRELAATTGVANGTAAAAIRDLEDQGFVFRIGTRGKRHLRNTQRLLDKWTEGYLQRLQQTTMIGTFELNRNMEAWLAEPYGNFALRGGETAVAVMDGFLTPEVHTLYTDDAAALIRKLDLRRAPGGRVVIRRKFWIFEDENVYKGLVPTVLTYADLMGEDDARCIEAANRLKEGALARLLD